MSGLSAGYTDEGIFWARQSVLATWSRCTLSAKFELDVGERWEHELARGTLAHAAVASILQTLWRTGEKQMPPYDGIQALEEVMAQVGVPSADVVVVPAEERRHLRKFISRFCEDWTWEPRAFLAVEQRLSLPIVCPDGVTRILTGQPDVLTRGAPDELVVHDAKSGYGPPKTPRDDNPKDLRAYLTARGHYQLDAYGLMGMAHYPRAQRCWLREYHPLAPEERQVREAHLRREDMDEVRVLIGADLMNLERALAEGDGSGIWKPMPGVQCAWCTKRSACPRASETRHVGGINDQEQAREYAGTLTAVTPYRTEVREALQAWVDVHGPIEVHDGQVLGWHVPEGKKGRKFEVHHRHAGTQQPEPGGDPAQLRTAMAAGGLA